VSGASSGSALPQRLEGALGASTSQKNIAYFRDQTSLYTNHYKSLQIITNHYKSPSDK
jgi:hypothetical protein